MSDFILVHRQQNGNPLTWNVPIWSTCLRQIAFVDQSQLEKFRGEVLDTDEVLTDSEALTFLLEVICGLRSPMLGETEVQGQFKKFCQQQFEHNQNFKSLSDALLSVAKKIRHQHLQDLGCHSYGSWIRKRLDGDESVGVVGSGHLASEILPWLKHKKKVTVYARNLIRAQDFTHMVAQVRISDLTSPISSHSLILAAPVENSWIINASHKLKKGSQVLDLRGENELSEGEVSLMEQRGIQYVSLINIMKEVSQNQDLIQHKIQKAKEGVRSAVVEISQKSLLRPGGWEDLCG